jgi:DNA-binding MurR/RpiR family transcriptional regulator
MKMSEYVSKADVKRVCKELGFRDWSALKVFTVTKKEAATILEIVNVKKMAIPVEEFRQGLDVELEHGTRYVDANVTNNHPILTGKIVLAHLKEAMDYYERLEVAEIEGDLLKAVIAKNLNKIEEKYKKLIGAQSLLNKAVTEQMK